MPPEQFAAWDGEAREFGFKAVASGPLVRSSYRAGLLVQEARTGRRMAPSPVTETYTVTASEEAPLTVGAPAKTESETLLPIITAADMNGPANQ